MGVYDETMRESDGLQPVGVESDLQPAGASDFEPFLPELDLEAFDAAFANVEMPSAPSNPRQADRATDVGGKAGELVRFAQQFVGTPYVWGGTSPDGFDCSGFVQYVYAKMGVDLPRISADQARKGQRVGIGNLQAGDLVAWDNSSRNFGADHIAIYLGGGLIIEAPRPGQSVRVRKLGDNEGAWGARVL